MRYSTVAFNLIVACTSIHASPTAQSGNPWLAAPAPQQGAAAAAAPVPVAAPAPAPAASPAAAPVPASPMASPLASPAGAGAAGTANMNGQPCAADINRLASGIQQNIFIQGDEVSTTQRIVDLLQQIGNGTVTKNQMVFNMGQGLKAQLLTFVDAGVAVRVSNQAITPAGNAVTAGLAKVCFLLLLFFNHHFCSTVLIRCDIGCECTNDGTRSCFFLDGGYHHRYHH